MKKTKTFYFASVALLVIPTTISCSSKNDFDILLSEYQDAIIASTKTNEFIQKGPDGILEELEIEELNGVKTYYYPDIDYDYGSDPDHWDAAQHTSDMLAIAVAAAKTHDNRYQEIAVGMTYYWIYHDYRNVNWWFNDLGAGLSLANTALFVYDDLNSQGKAALRSRVARTSFYYKPSLLAQSGSNLFDYAELTLKSSIINRNPEEFELAVKRMEDEIVDTNIEGFQPDGSFFQHGAQIQTMSNYGRSVIRIGDILRVVDKTSRHFSLDKLRILTHFILRGIGRGTFKGYSNYLEMAREYARKDETAKVETYLGLEAFLDLPNLPARHEFENFVQNLRIHRPTFNGITYFENAHLVTMVLDNLYISFEGSAPDVLATETVNGENKLGLNLSYGTNTCVMDEGPEYYQIAPYWDYAYLPGTTSIQVKEYNESDDILDYLYGSDEIINTIAFGDKEKKIPYYDDTVYGKTLPKADDTKNDYVYSSKYDNDNNIAILMQRSCHHEENNFTVTCVACEDGMFLMGADLEYTGDVTKGPEKIFETDPPIHTTIEQCFYKDSNFILSDDKTRMEHGRALYKTYDDGTGLNATTINVRGYDESTKTVGYRFKGDWNRNKNGERGTDMALDKHILLAYLDTNEHGKYAYSIQPTSYEDEDRKFELINNFKNDQKVQEVKLPNGKVVVVAYENVNDYKPSVGSETIDLNSGDSVIIDQEAI